MSRIHKKYNKYYAIDLIKNGYGLDAKIFNHYQIRIRDEDHPENKYDWYHTTGSLVHSFKGRHQKIGIKTDPEDVAIFIRKHIKKYA